jgi:hypothetical protein
MVLLIQLKNRSCGLLSVPRSETRKKRIKNVMKLQTGIKNLFNSYIFQKSFDRMIN